MGIVWLLAYLIYLLDVGNINIKGVIIKYKLNIKDMAFIISVMMVIMLILMGLDYLGVDLSAPIDLPSLDENTSMSPSGAMSGTIN